MMRTTSQTVGSEELNNVRFPMLGSISLKGYVEKGNG